MLPSSMDSRGGPVGSVHTEAERRQAGADLQGLPAQKQHPLLCTGRPTAPGKAVSSSCLLQRSASLFVSVHC